jgi:hypothetical protein
VYLNKTTFTPCRLIDHRLSRMFLRDWGVSCLVIQIRDRISCCSTKGIVSTLKNSFKDTETLRDPSRNSGDNFGRTPTVPTLKKEKQRESAELSETELGPPKPFHSLKHFCLRCWLSPSVLRTVCSMYPVCSSTHCYR